MIRVSTAAELVVGLLIGGWEVAVGLLLCPVPVVGRGRLPLLACPLANGAESP